MGMFVVPQNRSFLCEESLTVEMLAELVTTDKTTKDKLQKATITMKTFQFDAFRPDKSASSQFQPAISCISSQGDLVPIMVGCALAGLVLLILVIYLVGRKATKVPEKKGYTTM